ncbi:acetyltransferase [Mycena capillaripes]|nr:acetyltransferase [Mycena capillaripes]
MTHLIVFDPTNATHSAYIPSFADIHIACIEKDSTIATFMPPLKRDVIIDWWKERAMDAADGKRIIIMALVEDADGREQLGGYVILHRPLIEANPYRGSVEKLLVSPDFRRRGLARKLMERLEEEAKAHGQTLLVMMRQILETTTGGPAEKVYPKLGYIQLGIIPNSAGINPTDGSLMSGTFFWKQL